jgi:hypoxanthine phosphoribosyltransferase
VTSPITKEYISAEQLLEDSFRLGTRVLDSGFKPSFIVGVWRGGTPVGIAVQELLDFFGVKTDHIAIRTSLYRGIDERRRAIRVHGLQYLVDHVDAGDGLLLVDDVFDTGLSIEAILDHLRARARRNMPADTRVATIYFKPANNRTDRVPDFYVHETDRWLVFPHELRGLTVGEIKQHKRGVASFVDRL